MVIGSFSFDRNPDDEATVEKPTEVASDGSLESHNQREHKRMPISQQMEVCWLSQEGQPSGPIWFQATNISRGGLRLTGRSMAIPGTQGIVLLQMGGKGVNLCGIEVVFQRAVDGFMHEFGVKFIPLPTGTRLRYKITEDGPRIIMPGR